MQLKHMGEDKHIIIFSLTVIIVNENNIMNLENNI